MRLSVCLTHYNRPHLLAATLESLLRQTRPPDEVFLWDDASPCDPTPVVERFRDRFRHFVYCRQTENRGMPGNLNDVIAQATGDLVANLHDADIFEPSLLEQWESALTRHPSAGLVFCGLKLPGDPSERSRDLVGGYPKCTPGLEFFRQHYVGSYGSPIWGTVMVRRSVYEELLPFDPQFRNWADVDMWMRVCGRHAIAYVAEPLIELDATPTPVRKFSWDRFIIISRMTVLNLFRHAADQETRVSWLKLQRRQTMSLYHRLLWGRVWRGDIEGLREGLGRWRDVQHRLFERDWRLSLQGPVEFERETRTSPPTHRPASAESCLPHA